MSCTGAPEFKFKACCDQHDIAYSLGGGEAERAFSDYKFLECMIAKRPVILAFIYFFTVRVFGWIFYRYNSNPSIFEKYFK